VILQVKWTLVVCVFCYSSYIAAQFYPRFYTLIPTAIVLGFGAAPLWSAKCSYLTQLAHRSDGLQCQPKNYKIDQSSSSQVKKNGVFQNWKKIATTLFPAKK
jgi:hypothetical protein